jgi:hypothetical protein
MQFPEPTLTREFLSGFVEVWRLWLPLLLLLIWVGWATRRQWGGRLLLLSLIVLSAFAAKVTIKEQARERAKIDAWNKLRVPLPQTVRIDGLQLAGGTMVRWNKEREGPQIILPRFRTAYIRLGRISKVPPGDIRYRRPASRARPHPQLQMPYTRSKEYSLVPFRSPHRFSQ